MKTYPIIAFLVMANAVWAKLLHSEVGVALTRLLTDAVIKQEYLVQYLAAYETFRWNALVGWAIGLFLVVLTIKDPQVSRWIKYGLTAFCFLALVICILPD